MLAADVARGLEVRLDWGSQYRSPHFTGALAWLGITDFPAYPGGPECNGCAERWIKTLREQCLWARAYHNVDALRRAVTAFVELYNTQWLIERLGHRTPRQTYQDWLTDEMTAARVTQPVQGRTLWNRNSHQLGKVALASGNGNCMAQGFVQISRRVRPLDRDKYGEYGRTAFASPR